MKRPGIELTLTITDGSPIIKVTGGNATTERGGRGMSAYGISEMQGMPFSVYKSFGDGESTRTVPDDFFARALLF